tara:strand:- start:2464 stop:3516 length:1053 start_codon:yes stop_codon:yes gene_type:complete
MKNKYLKSLAIIVLTYDRQKFALRAMDFWNNKGVKLYVVDGSEYSIESVFLKKYNKSIIYKHDNRGYNERLKSILGEIDEPYLSVISEDEFLITSSLESCIKFLNENKDYSSCTGIPVLIDYSKRFNKILGYPIYRSFQNCNFIDNLPSKRIFDHLNNYLPTVYYGVNRTKIYKNAHKTFMEFDSRFFCQFELQLELMTCFEGKTKVLNSLHWIRTNENIPIRGTEPSWDPKYTFESFWSARHSDKRIFLKKMALNLKKEGSLKQKYIINDIEKAFNRYYLNILERDNTKKSRSMLRSKVKNLIPNLLLEYYHLKNNKINLKKICPKDTLIDYKIIDEIKLNIFNFYAKT